MPLSSPTLPVCALPAILLLGGIASPQTVYPTGTTIHYERADEGLTLFSPPSGGVVLIDMNGHEVHRWQMPAGPDERAGMVRPLPGGSILVITGGRDVLELDWQGNVVWSWTLPAPYDEVHHDVQRLANGNTLVLARETVTDTRISSQPLLDDCLLEVDPNGNIVWEWKTRDHFDQLLLDDIAKFLIHASGGDWAHTNAAEELPPNRHTHPALRAGNIILSQRTTNRVFIVDKATGDVVWICAVRTDGQHNPQMIAEGLPGAGNILLFDNGASTPYKLGGRDWSRVLEIDPVSNTVVWDYDASDSKMFVRMFWSSIVSGAQRLSNGDTLICSGVKGRLFQVGSDGEIVWEYMSPYTGPFRQTDQQMVLIYRATRVPFSFAQ